MPRDPGLREPLSADAARHPRRSAAHRRYGGAAAARVLDVGCGDGALLDYLVHFKQVDGRGIELSQAGVNACVGVGLSVIQGDADTDLADYPSDAFDYAILSQTLQATRDPKGVLDQLVRIARRAIVSFPNFGHWRMRWHLLTRGTMPVTPSLPAAVVRDAQHPSLHDPRFPAVLRRGTASPSSRRSPSTARAAPRPSAPTAGPISAASRGCSCSGGISSDGADPPPRLTPRSPSRRAAGRPGRRRRGRDGG